MFTLSHLTSSFAVVITTKALKGLICQTKTEASGPRLTILQSHSVSIRPSETPKPIFLQIGPSTTNWVTVTVYVRNSVDLKLCSSVRSDKQPQNINDTHECIMHFI